jgi:hypothetical protein
MKTDHHTNILLHGLLSQRYILNHYWCMSYESQTLMSSPTILVSQKKRKSRNSLSHALRTNTTISLLLSSSSP